jgi:hypothetical protein
LLIVGNHVIPPTWAATKQKLDGMTRYDVGFGQCLVAADVNIAKWEPNNWRAIVAMWDGSAQAWDHVKTPDAANTEFPVVEDLRIPVRGLFLVMVGFAIVIGPVNIVLLTRLKRRIMLLWTVPVFSVLTCVAVAGYMLLSEGWSGQVRLAGATILDERSGRATSVGWLGIYSPMTPGDGLRFGSDTEITPHLGPGWSRMNRSGAGRTVDWTDDQHLPTGWVSARVPAHFLVRSSEQRSERIRLDQENDGSRSATNELGAAVETIWVADAEGRILTATGIADGGKAVLTLTDKRSANDGTRLRRAYGQDWLDLVDALRRQPELYLRPGCYIAVLESAPFLEPGLCHAEMRRGQSVVLGIMSTP